jgi:hypothetical protein
MARRIDADKLIADLEKRRQVITDDKINFASTTGRLMQTGAIMALNDAITIIKKLAEEKTKQ